MGCYCVCLVWCLVCLLCYYKLCVDWLLFMFVMYCLRTCFWFDWFCWFALLCCCLLVGLLIWLIVCVLLVAACCLFARLV